LGVREGRSAKDDSEDKFPFSFGEQIDSTFSGEGQQPSSSFPSSTFLADEKSCFTTEGKLGFCTSVRSCYPKFKLPELSNLETWVIGTRGTCHYVEKDGRQVIIPFFVFVFVFLPNAITKLSNEPTKFGRLHAIACVFIFWVYI
jgi:hypothetical protein